MALQSRIVHGLYGWVLFEEARQGQRVLVLLSDAQGQRAYAAQEQPGVEWRQSGAENHARVPDPLDERGLSHHHAGDEVGVPAEVLGRTVEDQIDSQFQRLLV